MFLPESTNTHCPDGHPCGPGPAKFTIAHSIPVFANTNPPKPHAAAAPLGVRNALGIALLVVLTVLGLVLYLSFAKWPRKKLTSWARELRARRRPWRRIGGAEDRDAYTSSLVLPDTGPACPTPELSHAQAPDSSEKPKRGRHHATTSSLCSIDLSG